MAASDRERLWHRVVDWEIEVKDSAADLRAAQARHDEAVARYAATLSELAAIDGQHEAHESEQGVE
jgi:hypothetical protein